MKKKVVPGDFIAFEEEYLGGNNTFTDDSGNVFSEGIGEALFDNDSRTVNVNLMHPLKKLSVSSTVFAAVNIVKENVVLVRMVFSENKEEREIVAPTGAVIRVANVSRDYVKSLKEEFKIADLVKAKVCEITPFGIQLRTNEPQLGVVRAYCSKCRAPLHLFGGILKCLKCGNSEKRKISRDYILK